MKHNMGCGQQKPHKVGQETKIQSKRGNNKRARKINPRSRGEKVHPGNQNFNSYYKTQPKKGAQGSIGGKLPVTRLQTLLGGGPSLLPKNKRPKKSQGRRAEYFRNGKKGEQPEQVPLIYDQEARGERVSGGGEKKFLRQREKHVSFVGKA